jgi:hypothetical protein
MATAIQSSEAKATAPNWVQVVQDQVGAIRFGIVLITVHDGRVAQVERTEKVRFDRLSGDAHPGAAKSSPEGKWP